GFKKVSHNIAAIKVSRVEKKAFSQPVDGFYLDDGQENLSYSNEFPGLLIDNDANLTPKVLIPRESFKRGALYNLNIDGDRYSITAGKVLNKQRGWILFEALV
ncbi:MAG: hypothetical protein COB34_08550, partial [Methylophilaceae bacterium]